MLRPEIESFAPHNPFISIMERSPAKQGEALGGGGKRHVSSRMLIPVLQTHFIQMLYFISIQCAIVHHDFIHQALNAPGIILVLVTVVAHANEYGLGICRPELTARLGGGDRTVHINLQALFRAHQREMLPDIFFRIVKS